MSTLPATTSGIITRRLPQHLVARLSSNRNPIRRDLGISRGTGCGSLGEKPGWASGLRGASLGRLALLQQEAELALEVRDLLEVLVDAREAHVRDLARTSSPTSWLVTFGPFRRSRASTRAAAAATCSSVTGRFFSAFPIPETILSRRYGSFVPSRLMIDRPSSSTRSNVVYRRWQAAHSRRRRIAPPSSTDRESTTLSSSRPHHGHRTSSA